MNKIRMYSTTSIMFYYHGDLLQHQLGRFTTIHKSSNRGPHGIVKSSIRCALQNLAGSSKSWLHFVYGFMSMNLDILLDSHTFLAYYTCGQNCWYPLVNIIKEGCGNMKLRFCVILKIKIKRINQCTFIFSL